MAWFDYGGLTVKVFIWGTGLAAREVSLVLKQNVELLGYIDNNKENQGLHVLGKQVYSPEILQIEEFDFIIIGAYEKYREISQQLEEMEVAASRIIQFFNYTKLMPMAFFYNENYIDEKRYQDLFDSYVEVRT